jgi:hypothetical protein
MKKILFAFTSLALAAGCGGGGAEEVLNKMGGFKNKMCKCTTAECAAAVDKEQDEWLEKNASKLEKMAKDVTKEQEEKARTIRREMRECKEKAEGSADTAAPPAPPAPPANP